MPDSHCPNFAKGFYRSLLYLYPMQFRREYGTEMMIAFCQRYHEAQQNGGYWGVGRVWIWALGDLIRNIPGEHYSTSKGTRLMVKRSFDIVLSTLALWVGLPFLIPIALLIKLDSPGPVFYVSQRSGENGRIFNMYKFRSMTNQPVGRRVTRVGYVLRWTRIDEYPQVYNVLRGDMSFLGPRPMTLESADMFQLTAKPGLVPWFSH